MARGPLPNAQKRRQNPPTIATTALPASGRKGRPPNPPAGYDLREAGRNWWKWAWGTPQATAWDPGARYAVARRAQLEDDLAALDTFDPHSLDWFFSSLDLGDERSKRDAMRDLGEILGRLKALAGGRLAVVKEMRELEMHLGLGPKALAALRWAIVDDEPEEKPAPTPADSGATVHQIRAV